MKQNLDTIDHIAIQVNDIKKTIAWYQETFNVSVLYEDDSWAFLSFANIKLALVVPSEHPYHFAISRADAEKFGKLTTHRDNTESLYIKDNEGNTLEIIKKQETESD